MRLSKQNFLNSPHKAITLIGMSGVGKTTLSNKLSSDSWFHYSGDYRIGTRYLSEAIMDNIKTQAMQVPFLRDLLHSDSIYLGNNITINNLELVTTFLGKLGDIEYGGMQLNDFKARQNLHQLGELQAMLDVPAFIRKSQDIYQYPHFINDVGGSICEVATTEILQTLAQHTLIFYLQADAKTEQEIIARAIAHPKPMYYQPQFLDTQFAIYQQQQQQINPDEFSRWIFPKLIAHRKLLYQKIADDYGYTINAAEISDIHNEQDLLTWLASYL